MGRKILIVEDEFIIAFTIQEFLEELGYHVIPEIALEGARAIELAKEHSPDYIVMDIKLKGKMDGIDAASEILKWENPPKVIFNTAQSDPYYLERMKAINHSGIISKTNFDIRIKDILNKED